ncbi:MAG: hypothetical protein K2X97_06100, partial [Mycobacteriaceae bacterium]|nr:hypothetical protein [Mycobacteriaceae bacterium]
LVVGAPTQVGRNELFTITVTAVDAFGNVATGYRGTVGFSVTDPHPQDSLPADYAFQAGDHGVRTFRVSLRRRGTRTLTVRDRATAAIVGSANTTVL